LFSLLGVKVPPMELSLLGAKVCGNESSSYPTTVLRFQHDVSCHSDSGTVKMKMLHLTISHQRVSVITRWDTVQ